MREKLTNETEMRRDKNVENEKKINQIRKHSRDHEQWAQRSRKKTTKWRKLDK